MSPTTLEDRLRRDLAELAQATPLPRPDAPADASTPGASPAFPPAQRSWLRVGVGVAAAVVVLALGVLVAVREAGDTSAPAGPQLEHITPGTDWVWPSDDEEGIDRSSPEAVVREFARVVLGETDVEVTDSLPAGAKRPAGIDLPREIVLTSGTPIQFVVAPTSNGWAIGKVSFLSVNATQEVVRQPWVARSPEGIRRGDDVAEFGPFASDDEATDLLARAGFASMIVLELGTDGQVVGVVGLLKDDPAPYATRGTLLASFTGSIGEAGRLGDTGTQICLHLRAGNQTYGNCTATDQPQLFVVGPASSDGALAYAFLPTDQAADVATVDVPNATTVDDTFVVVARASNVGVVVSFPDRIRSDTLALRDAGGNILATMTLTDEIPSPGVE